MSIEFDLERSGATLAYDVFGLKDALAGDAARRDALRRLFEYVEDHDLYRHALPSSREFTAGLAAADIEFDANANGALWTQLAALDFDALVAAGAAALAAEAAAVAADVARAVEHALDAQRRCLAVHTTTPQYRSALGNALATTSAARGLVGAGIITYTEEELGEAKVKVSLRSIGDVDVAAVAKAAGGGGHKNAASFVDDADKWADLRK